MSQLLSLNKNVKPSSVLNRNDLILHTSVNVCYWKLTRRMVLIESRTVGPLPSGIGSNPSQSDRIDGRRNVEKFNMSQSVTPHLKRQS